MKNVRTNIYILSALIILTTSIILLSANFLFAYEEQEDQVHDETASLASLLEYILTSTKSFSSDNVDINSQLQPFIDQLTQSFPDYQVGYSAAFPESNPITAINSNFQSEGGQVLATVRPIFRDSQVIGHLWAYRDVNGFKTSYFNYISRHVPLLLLLPLLIFLDIAIIFHLFSKRNYDTYQELQRIARNKVIEAQEEERKRVSRELHDSIGQALYSVLVGLKILKNLKMENSFREHLLEMEKMTDKAMDEVKRMALELRPSVLDDLGLVPAIRSYLDRYELTFGIQTDFQLIGKHRRYSQKIETAFYRIVQEALTNAAKYSKTGRVEVQITDLPDRLILRVEDEGKGFQPGEKTKILGLGLYSMKERAESVGGSISIHSELNKGTRIEVQVEVEAEVEALYT